MAVTANFLIADYPFTVGGRPPREAVLAGRLRRKSSGASEEDFA